MLTFIPQEQAFCDGCQSIIPTDNIASKIDASTGVQTIEALCDHCRRIWTVDRQLNGGVWQIVGEVREVRDARRIERFEKKMAAKRGEMQVVE